MELTIRQVLLALGMLATGSINTLSKKAQNNCKVPGYFNSSANYTRTVHKFNHPWFQTLIMFQGEMFCLFVYLLIRWNDKRKLKEITSSLYTEIGNPSCVRIKPILGSGSPILFHNPKVCHLIFVIPTLCDVFGTTLAGIGLLYVDASVWQMLRGSIIIFTGLLSKVFLKRNLRFVQWLGIFMTTIGLVLVGLSSLLQIRHSHDTKVLLGIFLILGGQILSASQMIIEKIFIKRHNFPPLQVVGMEGTYGLLIMILIVLPALYFIPGSQLQGSYENSLDAIYQIGQDVKLLIFSLLYMFSISFYNFFGFAVTESLTAVHRTLIDACRTMIVWIVGLVVYYFINSDYGESFDTTYGIFQIDGFLFLLIGTVLYNGLCTNSSSSIDNSNELVPDNVSSPELSFESVHNTNSIDSDLEQSLQAAHAQRYVCH